MGFESWTNAAPVSSSGRAMVMVRMGWVLGLNSCNADIPPPAVAPSPLAGRAGVGGGLHLRQLRTGKLLIQTLLNSGVLPIRERDGVGDNEDLMRADDVKLDVKL